MKTCKADGCDRTDIKGKGYCVKHYTQIHRHGKILDITRFDKNEIVLYDDYAEIILTDKNGKECDKTLIDIEDIDKIKDIKWCKHHGYVTNNLVGYIHRFIMNCPNDMVVDHINHNPLDNRKSNLRICTQQENIINSSLNSNNTSGHTGVSWHKANKKWIASIQVNKKRINLGCYDTLEEAIKVREQAEIRYFGEYRNK